MVKLALLILIALGTLIVLALLSVLIGGSFETSNINNSITSKVNGTTNAFTINNISSSFYIDELTGTLIILIAILGVSAILGLRVINTGLSDESVRTLTILIFYLVVWLVFSALAYSLIVSIEVIGAFLYVVLTILFTLGVFQKIHSE